MEITILILLTLIFILILIYSFYFLINKENKLKELILDKSLNKEEYINEFKISKKRKITSSILLSLFFLVSLSFFTFSLSFKLSNEVFLVNDSYIVSIASNSMETNNSVNTYIEKNNLKEKFSKNDIVSFKKIDEDTKLNLYEVILFKYTLNDEEILIAHRIIEINKIGYVTRGDANSVSEENIILKEDILGTYEKILYFPSLINGAARSYNFICFFIYIIIILLVFTIFKLRETKLLNTYKE